MIGVSRTMACTRLVITIIWLGPWALAETHDYCQASTFNATCPPHQVILMESAFYGRMKSGSCVDGSYGQIGCKENVIDFMDMTCSGKRQCSVYIAPSELHERNRCPRDLAVYLEATYTCIKATTASQSVCSAKGKITVTAQHGYLTSQETIDRNLGTPLCPWTIRANPGQKISITYYNFGGGKVDGRTPAKKAPFSTHGQSSCYEVGTILEAHMPSKTITTCGSDANDREGTIYTSSTNEVQVTFLRREVLRTLAPFVMRYEATGCATNVVPPTGGHVLYDSGLAKVKCNKTEETWYLTCTNTQWRGARGNCSKKSDDSSWTFRQTLTEGSESFPYGILIVVSIGVALGVFIGGLVLSLVYFYMKRKRRPYQEPSQPGAQDYYQGTATLKKSTPHSPTVLVTHDTSLCPTLTFDDRDHVCVGVPHSHDGYFSRKTDSSGVQRLYDACTPSTQRSRHLYESPQVT